MRLLPLAPGLESAQVLFSPVVQNSLASARTCLHWPFMRSFPLKSPGEAGRPDFFVKSIAGDSNTGEKGSEETGISGLAFIIADTSMHRTSCVS